MNIPHNIYMVGIGGIGMSALAQMLVHRGHAVSGSDRERSPATDMLERQGIEVFIRQEISRLPDAADLLIYSDAVPEDNPARVRAREKNPANIIF